MQAAGDGATTPSGAAGAKLVGRAVRGDPWPPLALRPSITVMPGHDEALSDTWAAPRQAPIRPDRLRARRAWTLLPSRNGSHNPIGRRRDRHRIESRTRIELITDRSRHGQGRHIEIERHVMTRSIRAGEAALRPWPRGLEPSSRYRLGYRGRHETEHRPLEPRLEPELEPMLESPARREALLHVPCRSVASARRSQ